MANHFPDANATAGAPLSDMPRPLSERILGCLKGIASGDAIGKQTEGLSDSVASIAGGILGARCPETVNDEWCGVVEAVNHHGLSWLATELSKLRS
jgi:ADP-ribosylglycohydrolase